MTTKWFASGKRPIAQIFALFFIVFICSNNWTSGPWPLVSSRPRVWRTALTGRWPAHNVRRFSALTFWVGRRSWSWHLWASHYVGNMTSPEPTHQEARRTCMWCLYVNNVCGAEPGGPARGAQTLLNTLVKSYLCCQVKVRHHFGLHIFYK